MLHLYCNTSCTSEYNTRVDSNASGTCHAKLLEIQVGSHKCYSYQRKAYKQAKWKAPLSVWSKVAYDTCSASYFILLIIRSCRNLEMENQLFSITFGRLRHWLRMLVSFLHVVCFTRGPHVKPKVRVTHGTASRQFVLRYFRNSSWATSSYCLLEARLLLFFYFLVRCRKTG